MFLALWLLAATATQLFPDAPPRADAGPRLAGAATPISPAFCEPVGPETWRCTGLAGVEVRLLGPETARTIALGGDAPLFRPLPVAGHLSRTLDWRVNEAGQPVSASIGWRAVEGSEELVLVLRPTREGRPGCVSAVAGPDADLDALAQDGFRCGRERPRLAGTIPASLRAALESWRDAP